MDELAGVLRRQRTLLERLLYRLVIARHLLTAGEMRFLPWSAEEIERAVERVRNAELERAFVVEKIAGELGVSTERLTLRALADETPEPYKTVFMDHRKAFLDLVAEIESVSQANRKLAGQGMAGVTEVLELLDSGRTPAEKARVYGPDASARPTSTTGSIRFDGAL